MVEAAARSITLLLDPPAQAKPDKRFWAVAGGSAAVHLAVLAWLALPVRAVFPDQDAVSTVTIELMTQTPREVPREAQRAAPATAASPLPIPREARRPAPAGIAPSPFVAAPSAGSRERATGTHPAPLPAAQPGGDLKSALRGSSTGCANDRAVGLNRRERERCDERWGEAARNAPEYAAPIEAGKRREFDIQALRQEADRAYRDAPMGPGVDHRSRDGPGRGKDIPMVGGLEQDGLGRQRDARGQQLRLLEMQEKKTKKD
ncbi:hypothetical protein [Caulobacter endophyticus]|uniref:hypothetical protein n=1 Tax=Caulobacter endophyticus TaxID=2172652 RepID=UPI00240FEC34|nr:hypothetical protein [Caulobacter endophyticus]MDG2531517.1 hypothetical protein [Caulobacter endophyticus]